MVLCNAISQLHRGLRRFWTAVAACHVEASRRRERSGDTALLSTRSHVQRFDQWSERSSKAAWRPASRRSPRSFGSGSAALCSLFSLWFNCSFQADLKASCPSLFPFDRESTIPPIPTRCLNLRPNLSQARPRPLPAFPCSQLANSLCLGLSVVPSPYTPHPKHPPP